VDWDSSAAPAAVNALVQQFAFEYVNGYLEGVNERLAEYRDKTRPRLVAKEFREMIDLMPELTIHMPAMREHLLGYPQASLPDSTSFLYWQKAAFGLKPTIRISHVTIEECPDKTVVASKMLYASHYFWTALELRVLIPDPGRGQGFWFVTLNRSRSDGLSGFTGIFVRPRVRSKVRESTVTALQTTKRKLEQAVM